MADDMNVDATSVHQGSKHFNIEAVSLPTTQKKCVNLQQ
jgi:hypothetical protein